MSNLLGEFGKLKDWNDRRALAQACQINLTWLNENHNIIAISYKDVEEIRAVVELAKKEGLI